MSNDSDKALRRKRNIKRRLYVYGGLVAGIYAAYLYQPLEYHLFPKPVPNPNPHIDPDHKHLFAPGTKILVVTAHPDDSEFYVGATLSELGKTAIIHQVICTDGDKAYYGPLTNADENRRVRRQEATAAHEAWHGKGLTFLSQPDGRLAADNEVITDIANIITEFRPDYVLTFDSEYPPRMSHRDHRLAGEAAFLAAKRTGIPQWCLLFATRAPNYAVDISDLWDTKTALMANHKSQWSGKKLEGVSNMVYGFAETDGKPFGYEIAEGFRCVKIR